MAKMVAVLLAISAGSGNFSRPINFSSAGKSPAIFLNCSLYALPSGVAGNPSLILGLLRKVPLSVSKNLVTACHDVRSITSASR